MHKLTTAALAAAFLSVAYAASAGSGNPDSRMPDASAYVSLGFGAPRHVEAPLAYGFQFGDTAQGSVRQQTEARFGGDREWHAPLLRMDFTRGGWRTAKLDGVPLFRQKLNMDQDEGSGGGGWFSDWSALDWGLLAIGTVGVGVLAAQAFKGSNSPENTSTATTTGSTSGGTTTGSTSGGLLGGLLGGSSGGSTTGSTGGGLLGGLLGGTSGGSTTGTSTGGLLGGLLGGGGFTSIDSSNERERDAEYQHYLDGGTGHMGDLGG